ncbi:hypothetical protein LTR78_006581 [Recurvomyces mirabilis]|uniref:Imidazoleglycerol-phosphate dehydratase n=1 Tax=Recurvomyces mirabilis TaxID=574656 RepID=A0AAE0WL20_9PEZI|nr:hypothetical protein LTR78_006581 [Recurvomyces mirabilis]KAK5154677.1 hypothetical protein LTS14_006256 [Recurvomyces mirabilis]
MVRKHGDLKGDKELDEAAWVAGRGAVIGALKWGLFSAAAGGLGFALSPLYRGLTFQFKVFLQMSGMTLGSMIEADKRLREHEVVVRRQKVMRRDAEVWKRYEAEFLDKEVDQRVGKGSK